MVNGKREWDTLNKDQYTKREAKAEAQKRDVEGRSTVDAIHTFRELADKFFANRDVAEATKFKTGKFVDAFDGFLQSRGYGVDVSAVTDVVIFGYMTTRKDAGYKPASINFEVSCLKWIFKKFHAAGVIKQNPADGIRYLKEERGVKVLPTKEEIEGILGWFRVNERLFYPWVYFEMTRGWRRDELRLMMVVDVDLEGEKLYVKHTKTGVQRIERLTVDDCLVLSEHLIGLKKAGLYQGTGYLFPAKKGGLMCKNALLKKIKQASKALGITKNITNHLFRHYVVTSILDATANTEVVKAITGHKDTKTILEHYAHATPENVKRGLDITRLDTGLSMKSVSKFVSKKDRT
jgi:site-specific recombinase XerD